MPLFIMSKSGHFFFFFGQSTAQQGVSFQIQIYTGINPENRECDA